MTPRQLIPVVLLLALLGPACGGGSDGGTGPSSPEPARLLLVDGSVQAFNRAPLSLPPVVQLLNRSGDQVARAGVVISVTLHQGPGGTLQGPAEATTDDQGRARFDGLSLVGAAGGYHLRFSAPGLGPDSLTVYMEPGPPAIMRPATPESVTVEVAHEVAPRVSVIVMDQDSNRIAGTEVRFLIVSGSGSTQGGIIGTNSTGVATLTTWLVSQVAGRNVLVASAGAQVADTFIAIGVAGPPGKIEFQAGNNQSGQVATALPVRPAVRVRDVYNNPVAGVAVEFNPTFNRSRVADSAQVTDTAGIATAGTWSLGTQSGDAGLAVRLPATPGLALTLTVHILPGPVATMETFLPFPDSLWFPTGYHMGLLALRVFDQYHNSIPGVPVTFAVTSGGTTSSPGIVTDFEGVVRLDDWVLGPVPGPQTLTAAAGPARLVRTARSHAGRLLATVSGDSQPVVVGTAAVRPVVKLTDIGGAGVAGVPIAFGRQRGSEDGVLGSPDTVFTGLDGTATAPTWQVGTSVLQGSRVVALANGLTPVVITAVLQADTPTRLFDPHVGPVPSGFVGTVLPDGGNAKVEDKYGNGVPGIPVAWTVLSGTPTLGATAPTDLIGVAKVVVTLPTRPATIRLRATSAVLPQDTVLLDLVAVPGPFHHFEVLGGDGQQAAVRKQLPASLVVRLLDPFNNPMPGLDAAFQAVTGGGRVTTIFPVADSQGIASSQWILGPLPGPQTLSVTRAGISTTFTATATPATPVSLNVIAGSNQSVRAGATTPIPVVVQLKDADGFGAAGAVVNYAVTAGGGSLPAATATSDSNGIARVTGWALGAGSNQLTATVTGAPALSASVVAQGQPAGSSFNIALNYATTPSPAVQQAFANAAARWSQVIVGDIPDQPVNIPANTCYNGQGAFSTTVDDLLLYVLVVPIDGTGGILGGTGVCLYRASGLPAVAIIELDSDDLLAFPAFVPDIVLHEMGHAVGVGSSWQFAGLVQGANTPAPLFTGPAARQGYWAVRGGTGTIPGGVPLETQGGAGTRDVHWAESNFGSELMTGFVNNPPNPMSLITTGSLQDLGYQVDNAAADLGYTTAGLRAQAASPTAPFRERAWTGPTFEVGPDGTIRPR